MVPVLPMIVSLSMTAFQDVNAFAAMIDAFMMSQMKHM
jgi:hypothetical protein